MGSDFLLKISDIAQVFDGPHATPKKIDIGPYFLSISSLEDGQLDLSKSAHLSEEQFEKWTKRVTPQEGDVLFSYETRLGEAALMPKNVKACLGRRMGLLRPDRNKVLPEYLLYAYMAPAFQQEIKRRTIYGATVERISLRELPDFNIRIPDLTEQMQVVDILNALNGKIALNRQINQTLEQMAQTLFKSWFVDFDPVIDNALDAIANGQDIEIPESLAKRFEARKAVRESEGFEPLPADIRQLFPCEFEESELGFVPKGWGVKDITELVDTVSVTYPLKTVDKVIFLNTGDIENGKFLHANYSSSVGLPGQAKKSIQKNDILFSEIRPQNKRFAFVNFKADEYVVSTKLMVLRAKNGIDSLLPYFILSLDKTIRDLQRIAELRSGTFPQITYKELGLISLVLPNEKQLIDVFVNQYLHPIYNRKFAFLNENEELIKLRDTLLPKLISGELRLDSPQGEALQQAVSAE